MRSLREMESTVFNRVNPVVGFSVRRYVLAIGVFVAIVAFGIISALGLGVDLLPQVNVPVVLVVTTFPGATPSVVDQQVTQVIENTVSGLANITDLNSTSSIGVSRVIISFDPSVDKNAVADQVATLVAGAVRNLPTGTSAPIVRTFDPNSQPVIQFGISGGAAPLSSVADYVQKTLTPALERVPGVANIQVDGAPSRTFEVLLNPQKLKYFNLNPQTVVTAITSAAVSSPIGSITTQNNSLTFSMQNVPSDLAGIQNTLVDPSRGIAVNDIGSVREVPAVTDYARVNGVPQVLVSVQGTTDSNTVSVVDGVQALLAKLSLPAGYAITVSNDTTGPIRSSVDATFHELIVTVLVVALIVLLFLGKLNTAFSVILAIPIALSAAPILYNLSGFTFNLVSLLALIIAIGIVVDDSIVVAENVERYRAMGLGLKESVLKGASEVFSAVVAASLSLLSVLLPVSFIGGFIGRYLQQFSLGLAAAVAFSLFEAVLFLTVRLAYTPESHTLDWKDLFKSLVQFPEAIRWGWKTWRKGLGIILGMVLLAAGFALSRYLPGLGGFFHAHLWVAGIAVIAWPLELGILSYVAKIIISLLQSLTTTFHGWTEAGLEWVRGVYTRGLRKLLGRSMWILLGAAAFLVLSALVILPRLAFNFVPQTDYGTLTATLRFPAGTPIDVVNAASGKLETYLTSQPAVRTTQTIVSDDVQVTAQLSPVGTRPNVSVLTQSYRGALVTMFRDQPSIRVAVSSGGFGGFGPALQLNLVAPDYNTLLDRNDKIIQVLQANPYIADVTSSLSDVSLESDFVPDPGKLKGTGITPSQIAQALQTYASGSQAADVITGGLSYPIQVQADPTQVSSGQSLLNLPIYSPALQQALQIGQLGKFILREAPITLSRANRQYTGGLTINMKANAPPPLTLQNQITAELTNQGLIGGSVTLTANSRFSQTALAGQLATSGPLIFLLAMFLAFLVMAAQFNSWRYPVYLLLPVPLAVIGALWLVWIIGGGLDIFGLLGMLMLIGLSAKNAILYLDFVVQRIGKMPFADALIEAARLRFRPIIMTTLTVLVISFPLIFSGGSGSEFGQRMGVVMLGGIVFSAVLTFFVVPAAFYLFERKRVEKLEPVSEASPYGLSGSPAGSPAAPEP